MALLRAYYTSAPVCTVKGTSVGHDTFQHKAPIPVQASLFAPEVASQQEPPHKGCGLRTWAE